jgi:hypothetical protein
MPRGTDLAVVLLGILKAGGSYTWPHAGLSKEPCVSIVSGPLHTDAEPIPIDITAIIGGVVNPPSPNLPVITRGTDIACVLQGDDDEPVILVPHDALTALRHSAVAQQAIWIGEPGAFELWLGLMKGMTVVIGEQPDAVAAA